MVWEPSSSQIEVAINGDTPDGWFVMENPRQKLMIWGYLYFRKPPNGFSKIITSVEVWSFQCPRSFVGMPSCPKGRRTRNSNLFFVLDFGLLDPKSFKTGTIIKNLHVCHIFTYIYHGCCLGMTMLRQQVSDPAALVL